MQVLRVIVDSNHRISGTSSDFTVQLPQTVSLPHGTKCFVSDVVLPVSWYGVTQNVNDRVYFEYGTSGTTTTYATLDEGSYDAATLATQLAEKMSNVAPGITYTATYTSATNLARIVPDSGNLRFLSTAEIEALHSGYRGSQVIHPMSNLASSFQDVFLDVRGAAQVLLNCAELAGDKQTLGPRGAMSTIKRIAVTVPFGEIQFTEGLQPADGFEVSNRTLSRLSFRLTDIMGHGVDLHGLPVSFSLVFHEVQ